MRRIADMGVRFSQLPHHRAVLADPGVAADRAQRDDQRHGHDRGVRVGLPGHLDPDPVRERVHLRGAGRARVQHVLRRQVASHARRGVQPRGVQGTLAARPRVRALLRVARRRDELVLPGPRPRQPPHRAAGAARGRLPPRRRHVRPARSSSSATRRSSTPTSRSSCTSPRRPGTRRTSSPPSGRTATRASSTRATRQSATGILARQKELGLLPGGHELSPINPHGEPATTGPDGQPWPMLDTVRPWGSLSDDERRLFCADGRGVRRLHLLLRRPARTRARLPRGGRASWTTRSSSWSPTTAPAARAARTAASTSGASSTACPTPPRRRCRTSTSSGLRRRTTTTTPGGRGRSTRRSRTGSAGPATRAAGGHVPRRLAGEDRGPGGRAPPVHPRRRRRPDAVRAARHRAARGAQGLPTAPDRGRELRGGPDRRERAGQVHAVLRDARAALDLPRGLAGLHRPPAAERLGQVRAGRVGALPPRDRPLAVHEPRRAGARSAWRPSRRSGTTTPAGTTACRSTTARRSSRSWPSGPRAAAPRDRYTFYPDCADVPESAGPLITGRSYTIAAGVDGRLGRRPGRDLGSRRRPRRSQPLHQGRAAALHVQLGRHDAAGRRRRTARSRRARTSTRPSSRANGDAAETRRCPAARNARRSTWTTRQVGSGEIVTQPGYFCLTGRRHLRRPRQRLRRHPGVRGAVRLHGRHDRQGGRRRLRRALRRPRGRGPRAGS